MKSVAWSIAVVCALILGACSEDTTESSGSGSGYFSAMSAACRPYTTCSTCTPVLGCGWCFDSDGTGECVSGPDDCRTQVFSWTWNESGCRIPADAGTGPVVVVADDAGAVAVEASSGEGDDAGVGASDAGAESSSPFPLLPVEVP